MNILVVEDSQAIRRLLLSRLNTVPTAQIVGEAIGEQQAIQMIREKQPDLVLLDLSLAPGSGLNVLRQARAEGQMCKMVVLTHQPLDAYRQECEALGADGFHDKGTEIELVVDRVREWAAAGV